MTCYVSSGTLNPTLSAPQKPKPDFLVLPNLGFCNYSTTTVVVYDEFETKRDSIQKYMKHMITMSELDDIY